jgi:hypothetical protein
MFLFAYTYLLHMQPLLYCVYCIYLISIYLSIAQSANLFVLLLYVSLSWKIIISIELLYYEDW